MNPIKNQTFVYFVRCDKAVKIGVSTLPEQRINLIKTDNYQRVEILGIVETPRAYEAEHDLHEIFADFRIKGEWFELDNETIERLVEATSFYD